MDIQAIASQLMGQIGENPDMFAQFVQHPYSTTAAAAGTDEKISKSDMSQVVTQMAAQATGQSADLGDIAGIASTLLAQNGGSVHSLTSALFGGAQKKGGTPSLGDIAVKSILGGVAAKGMGDLIGGMLGGKKK